MKLTIFILCFVGADIFAASPNLDLITADEAQKIGKEFSANFIHTPVSGAAALGDIFGFELGVIGGLTEAPETERLSKLQDTSSDFDKIPHAGLYGAVSFPLGITGELSMIPKMSGGGVSLKYTSLGLKWTFSKFLPIPLDLAVRLHGSSSELSYTDTINNSSTSNTDVLATSSWDNTTKGINIVASKKFLFVEPYIGLGYVSTDTDITVSGSASIFNFSTASSYSTSASGAHTFVGANLNLLFFKIGLEYSQVMGLARTSGKLSFYF